MKPYYRNTVFNLHPINRQLTLCLLTQAKLQQWVSSHHNVASVSRLVHGMRIPQSCLGAGQYLSYRLNTFSHSHPKSSKATWVIQQSSPLLPSLTVLTHFLEQDTQCVIQYRFYHLYTSVFAGVNILVQVLALEGFWKRAFASFIQAKPSLVVVVAVVGFKIRTSYSCHELWLHIQSNRLKILHISLKGLH